MGLVKYTARRVEQVAKSFAEELLGRDADQVDSVRFTLTMRPSGCSER